MTAPLRATPRPSAVPASQHTAPVAEFRCLFTHDVRRKQKRWHDGYLKFHSFNSRVMVYDTSRNFLGDTYYKESSALHEGDELTLDKGIMIEVADAVGVTQTDLAPLFEKRKDSPQRGNAGPASRPAPHNALRVASQLRHKSLNSLLGTQRGPVGKSAPMRSPFEARKEKENQFAAERPSKRQKTAHIPLDQRGSSPTTEQELAPAKNPRQIRTTDVIIPRATPRSIPRDATIIAIPSETDGPHLSSGVTLPDSPPALQNSLVRPQVAQTPVKNRNKPKPPTVLTTPRLPKGRVPVPRVKAQETPRPPPSPSSPPVSASNRLSNVDFAIQPIDIPPKEPTPRPSPPRAPKVKSLRLSVGVKRGTLLCQAAPQRRKEGSNAGKRGSQPSGKTSLEPARDNSPLVIEDDLSQRSKSSISRKTTAGLKNKRAQPSAPACCQEKNTTSDSSPEPFDDMEMMHGLMDQQLAVTPSPPRPDDFDHMRQRDPLTATNMRSTAAKKAFNKATRAQGETHSDNTVRKVKKGTSRTAKDPEDESRRRARPVEKPLPLQPPLILEPTDKFSRCDTSRSESLDEYALNSSTSTLPTETVYSTSGSRKKPRRAQKLLASEQLNTRVPSSRQVNKSKPLMSTTELSALLQKGSKSSRIEDDPIIDGTQNASPDRSFRRTRSENDAPIPSTSAEWEKRNLPDPSKASADNTGGPQEQAATAAKSKAGGLADLVKKTDPRRKFQRTQSLNVNTNVPNDVGLQLVSPPPVDDDVGPWSTEAFDLFDWRPPAKDGSDNRVGVLAG